MRTVAPGLPVHRHSELAAHYRKHYLSREDDIPLFPGAAELLEELEARLFTGCGDGQDARRT